MGTAVVAIYGVATQLYVSLWMLRPLKRRSQDLHVPTADANVKQDELDEIETARHEAGEVKASGDESEVTADDEGEVKADDEGEVKASGDKGEVKASDDEGEVKTSDKGEAKASDNDAEVELETNMTTSTKSHKVTDQLVETAAT